jgi:hypothetical protein
MTIDVVVARFNEDLTWTSALFRPRLFVYNKGDGPEPRLPNVGREAQTYLHHMIEHRGDYAEWTFFTQGDPNRHLPFSQLQGIVNGWPKTDFRSALWIDGGPTFFVNQPVRFEGKAEGECWEKGVPEVWRELFEADQPGGMVFAPAAIFAISRDKLLARSSAFYLKAMALVCDRPRGPWEFERLWAYLWTSLAATRF